jgi:hypothetical protein
MKKIIAIIITGLVLLISGTAIAGEVGTQGALPPTVVIIDCGDITISSAANPDICICVPINHANIDVGDGDTIKVLVDFSITCTSWDDTGYVDICFPGTSPLIHDEDFSGDIKSGTLEISNYYNPDVDFTVQLHAKLDYQYSSDLEDTKTSICSTAPYTPPQPELELTPYTYTYPETGVGHTSSQTFTLTNIGTGTANGHVYLTNTEDFYIQGVTTFHVSTQPWTFVVVFAPQSQGPKQCTVVADASNCDDVEAYIDGTAGMN